MLKSSIALLCASLSACLLHGLESVLDQHTHTECGEGPKNLRAGLRYSSPRGIGYKKGYTTLEGFFTPHNLYRETSLPFLDARAHLFNNGKFAANTGLGVRFLKETRIWGFNAYYDYRDTSHQHFNQIGTGLENLGRLWDFRINGYLPVGNKKQSTHNTTRFALKAINGEVGFHIDHFKGMPFYFAGGPYYLTGDGQKTWGGEIRGRVDSLEKYLRLEGITTYDHLFGWIGQVQASINIPFGKRREAMKRSTQSCSQTLTLETRIMQPVDRNEIIPESKK